MKDKIKAIVIFFILSLIMLSTKIMAQTNLNGQQYTNTSIIIITNNSRFGYGFSITGYNGLVYIYYTELQSSIATINGLIFNGTEEMNAPLPNFNDLGEGSPLLVELNNGSLMLLWGGVPMGNYSLNNLTILLQASILNNNVWGPVINLTNNGDALSYYSDGNYIYLVYEPTLSLTYNNTILEELTLSGNVVKSLNIPGIVGIVSANNGYAIVQFVNSTYALININNGSIEFVNATIIGFIGNSLYQFYNGVLTINQNLTFNLPIYESAFPISWNNGYVIIAWRPGLLSVYYWNGTELQPVVNYTVQFTIIPRATILNNNLYLAWFGLNNISTSQGSIYMAITPLPYQINQYNNITTTNSTINNTSTISTSNTSSYNSIQNTTSNKSLFSSIPIWVIIIVVGIVVFFILY
ncbi:hypothetical protein [Candidatus Nanobsidianus stetteri]|uniref:Uncharacterized protein n=1 Tax=Nanobsidianus stetteri TaxID=1294122 RepID=A0A2T9WLF8_NANST|nr:hypothetical protein [Candidatus Nanobsidianus stetteri]MCC5447202.1 hypothetical protein [Candidatus Nanobsidianus stetteri]